MSDEYTFDKLIAGMSDKKVGENAGSILEMLKEVNKVLGELQKTVDFFKRVGILPGMIRAYGKSKGIDMETPLANEMSVAAPSSNHKTVMENISKLSEEQLLDFVKAMQDYGKKAIESGKPGNKKPDSENN